MTEQITTDGGQTVELTAVTEESADAALVDGFNGFGTNPRRRVISQEAMKEAGDLMGKALKGNRRAILDVQEAFSTSDFTLAAFALIDQEMVAQYEELPSTWSAYTAVTTVRDFKPKHLRRLARSTVGLKRVPELSEYPMMNGQESKDDTIQVGKFGGRFAISWEAWVNDEAIDEIGDIPAWMSAAAAETDAITAASNLVTASGVNTSFFKSANGNAPKTVPLTLANLDAAIEEVKARKVNGRAVAVPRLVLVTPPSLTSTAQRILTAQTIRTTVDDTQIESGNYLQGSVRHVEDPALAVVNTSAKAGTTWFLLPEAVGNRAATYLARLRGHENPEIRVKADTGSRVGGGAIAAEDGSFDIDDVQYRVRHVVGAAPIDPTFTYASTGS